MNSRRFGLIAFVACSAIALQSAAPLQAEPFPSMHAKCSISQGDKPGTIRLRIDDGKCGDTKQCGSNFGNEMLNRFSGFSLADLSREGAQLTATLAADAGTFTCKGTIHDAALQGDSVFMPDEAFVERMGKLGFTGFTSEKLLAYAFVGVDSEFARQEQQTGVHGITTDNLIALRIFNVDPAYIHSIEALGYGKPDADKLIGLAVQKVDAEEVRQFRALGYNPTLDELIQIRIFKITPDFIKRMQARGLNDLTIGKLVQIRIFKLDE